MGVELDGPIRIPTRTRRQTMDWGLVLASQGIMATIDDGATTGEGWALLVAATDYPAALQVIQLHRQDHRHWYWQQRLPWQGLLFDWSILLWVLLMVTFYFLSQTTRPDFLLVGRMDNAAVRAGEWWRLFTAMSLHADLAHLVANTFMGTILLGLAMGRYGGGIGLLTAYLAGAIGNIAGFLLYPETHLGLGASGMVMGGLGLLAAQSLAFVRSNPLAQKYVLRGVIAGVLLFVLFGLRPGTDIIAHFIGFVTGLGLGAIVMLLPARWQNSATGFATALVLIALIVGPWWLALR